MDAAPYVVVFLKMCDAAMDTFMVYNKSIAIYMSSITAMNTCMYMRGIRYYCSWIWSTSRELFTWYSFSLHDINRL